MTIDSDLHSNKDTNINLRVRATLKADLAAVATALDTTTTAIMTDLMKRFVREHEHLLSPSTPSMLAASMANADYAVATVNLEGLGVSSQTRMEMKAVAKGELSIAEFKARTGEIASTGLSF